jgi:hypothetical protein
MYHYEYGSIDFSSTMQMLQLNMASKKTKKKNEGNEISSQGHKGSPNLHEKLKKFTKKRLLFVHFKEILPSPNNC